MNKLLHTYRYCGLTLALVLVAVYLFLYHKAETPEVKKQVQLTDTVVCNSPSDLHGYPVNLSWNMPRIYELPYLESDSGGKAELSFIIFNDTTSAVSIKDITKSCSCGTHVLESGILDPQKSTKVTFTLNLADKIDKQRFNFQVITDKGFSPAFSLTTTPLHRASLTTSIIDCGSVSRSGFDFTIELQCVETSADRFPAEVICQCDNSTLSVRNISKVSTSRIAATSLLKQHYHVCVHANKDCAVAEQEALLKIVCIYSSGEKIQLRAVAKWKVRSDFKALPSRIFIAKDSDTTGLAVREFKIARTDNSIFQIKAVATDNASISLTSKRDSDTEVVVTVSVDLSKVASSFLGKVIVLTGEAEESEVIIPVVVHVK